MNKNKIWFYLFSRKLYLHHASAYNIMAMSFIRFFINVATSSSQWKLISEIDLSALFWKLKGLSLDFLDLSSDPSTFLIQVSSIFLGHVQLIFSAGFEDTLLYEISEDIFYLKYNFNMFCFSLEWCCW